MGTGAASAAIVSIDVTKMDFYPPGATSPSFTDPSVSGSVNAAGTGSFNSGVPFFGVPWTASQQAWFDSPGAHTWSGTSASGAYNYQFTLAAGQVAVGTYFTWSVNSDIPVLAVFDCGAGTVGSACTPVDTDGDGAPGTAMQTPPFPGQTPAFSGVVSQVSAVPVPAAVWLFGSGLMGLVGVARRRKAA